MHITWAREATPRASDAFAAAGGKHACRQEAVRQSARRRRLAVRQPLWYRKGRVERFYRTHATDVHRAALVVYLSKCALRYLSKYTLS
jgi:hypothetical protein